MKRSVLMGCAGLAIAASAMAGPGELSPTEFSGQKFMAKRAAKAVKMADGSMRRVGEWVNLEEATTRGTTPEALWDASELCPRDPSGAPVGFIANLDPDGNPDGTYSNSPGPCDDPTLGAGNRWFFGAAAVNVHYIADYQDAVAATDITDVSMSIWYQPDSSAGCLIFINSWDTLSLDGVFLGNGDVIDGFISGVILDYGAVAPTTGGYYLFGANALPAGFLSTAADLEGGFEFLIVESFEDTDGDGVEDTVFLHNTTLAGIQPMLWGTGEDRVPADTTRAGTSTSIQYDDDAPLDLIWTPGFDDPTICAEAYSYDYTGVLAPSIIGASFSVYGILGGGCPSADFNGDDFVDFFDYDDYVACFETGCGEGGLGADFNGDGFVDFFDYDDFVYAFEGCP